MLGTRRTARLVTVLCSGVLALSLGACTDSVDAPADPADAVDTGSADQVGAEPRDVMGAPLEDPVLDFSGTYVVTSIFRGDGECLDASYGEVDPAHGGAHLAACDGGDGQRWQIREVTPQLYQFVSRPGGEEVCLNSNDRDSPVADGAAFAEPCRSIAEQVWTVEPTADGYIRLHSRVYADSACLESNEASSTVHAGSTFMDDCQEVSGQYWYLKNA